MGSSDCEAIGEALLKQPVNAVTSFAYVVVALIVVVLAVRGRRAIVPSVVYGSCVAAIGFGSVLFHGPQTRGSQVLHDLPILLTLLFVMIADVAVLVPRLRRPWLVFVGASAAATALTIADSGLGNAATGIVVATTVVLEVVVYRTRARNAAPRRQLAIYGLILAVVAVAAAAWLLGRTDSPVCDPDAIVQFHGLWHLISATLFGLWWWLALWEPHVPSAGDAAASAA